MTTASDDTQPSLASLLKRVMGRVGPSASGQLSGMSSGQSSGQAHTGTPELTPPDDHLGACALLPWRDGQYLLERNTPDHATAPGKLRPPGGGAQPHERDNLEETIVRELREEFGLSARETRPNLTLLGYQGPGEYRGSAVFQLEDHGLKPGTYQASNSLAETVTLEPAYLDDPDYVGPKPGALTPEPPTTGV